MLLTYALGENPLLVKFLQRCQRQPVFVTRADIAENLECFEQTMLNRDRVIMTLDIQVPGQLHQHGNGMQRLGNHSNSSGLGWIGFLLAVRLIVQKDLPSALGENLSPACKP